ncbi:MAG: asparagine synthase (glutamine-hydrolyzing) [Pseudomonadota bacterium]
MCGFFATNYKVQDVNKLLEACSYRGPDSSSHLLLDGIVFGFNRLAIIDLNERANQPFWSSCGRYVLLFNGEIYNCAELKGHLKLPEESYTTSSDTEVLMNYLIKFGLEGAEKLNGMFAFVFYDKETKNIIVARDRFGVKPLFYSVDGDKFLFTSDPKIAHLVTDLKPNLPLVQNYVAYRFLPTKFNLFSNLVSLHPGTALLKTKISQFKTHCWTDLGQNLEKKDYSSTTIEKSTEFVERLLKNSLISQMNADVPVGFFLSGGLDSSLLVAIAAKESSERIRTFSITFSDYEHSETQYQRLVSSKFNTIHEEMDVSHESYYKSYLECTSKGFQPILIPNYVCVYQLAQNAKRSVKVLLSGEGADEVFGGYHRYSDLLLAKHIKTMKLQGIFKILALIKSSLGRFSNIEQPDEFFNSQKTYFQKTDQVHFFKQPPVQFTNQYELSWNDLNTALLEDQQTYMLGLLNRVDQMTMLASIESRVPYLDIDLVNYVNSLRFEDKVGIRSPKKILYNIGRTYLPKEILERPKIGFSVPISDWFTGQKLMGELKYILLEERSRKRNLIDYVKLEEVFSSAELTKKYGESLIFPMLSIELWLRNLEDSPILN